MCVGNITPQWAVKCDRGAVNESWAVGWVVNWFWVVEGRQVCSRKHVIQYTWYDLKIIHT